MRKLQQPSILQLPPGKLNAGHRRGQPRSESAGREHIDLRQAVHAKTAKIPTAKIKIHKSRGACVTIYSSPHVSLYQSQGRLQPPFANARRRNRQGIGVAEPQTSRKVTRKPRRRNCQYQVAGGLNTNKSGVAVPTVWHGPRTWAWEVEGRRSKCAEIEEYGKERKLARWSNCAPIKLGEAS